MTGLREWCEAAPFCPPPPAAASPFTRADAIPSLDLDRCVPPVSILWLDAETVDVLPTYNPGRDVAFNSAGWIALTDLGFVAVTYLDGSDWILSVRDNQAAIRGAADPWYRHVVASGAGLAAPTVVASGVNLLLVAESSGTVVATYASVLSPRTVSFTPLVRVTPGTDTGASRPAACVGPDGIARVVYTAARDGVFGVYLATEFVPGLWLPSTVDTSTVDPQFPSIAAGNGALVVAWRASSGTDDGVYTWAGAGTVQVVAGQGAPGAELKGSDPSVCVVPDFGLVAGFTVNITVRGRPDLETTFSADGRTWSPNAIVGGAQSPDLFQAFFQPASDGSYLAGVWEELDTTAQTPTTLAMIAVGCANRAIDGLPAGQPVYVAANGREGRYPTVAVRAGVVHVAWIEPRPSSVKNGATETTVRYRQGLLVESTLTIPPSSLPPWPP